LSKLDLEAVLLGLCVLARRDVDGRPDEATHLAGRVANAGTARLQPVPLAIGMTNPVFRLAMIGPSLQMTALPRLHPGVVIGMNIQTREPCFAGGHRSVRVAAVQQL